MAGWEILDFQKQRLLKTLPGYVADKKHFLRQC